MASHLVRRQESWENDANVTQRASYVTVKNVLERNPRLPTHMVEQVANAEINDAQKNGKLFTAKELEDIEDRVYAQANTKVRYSHDRYAAMDKTQTTQATHDTMGILR